MRIFQRRLWLLVSMMALAACAPAAIQPARLPTTPSRSPGSPTPASQPGSVTALVEQAVADLASRLNVPASQIEVVSSEAVIWPDGSLGCPQPGMAYIQILLKGHRIRLKAGDRLYEYHGGERQAPFLCENPTGPASVEPQTR